jgi:allantoinase
VKLDLAIVGGEITTSTWHARGTIGIKDGRIALITEGQVDATHSIDAVGLVVIPGVIDAHTHFRDPAYPEKEDFTSGTRAAAAGGVTTVMEMPMADVGVSTAKRFQRRLKIVKDKAVVDFALYGGAGEQNIDSIQALADAGAIAFKTFMREPYVARATNFEGTWAVDDGALYQIARSVAKTGLLWSVHAENYAIITALQREVEKTTEPPGPDAFAAVRPPFVEWEAVAKLISFAEETGARLHIAHITTRRSIEEVKSAQHRGLSVTAEACLPHLMLTEQSIVQLGPLGRFTPRLRSVDDQRALWDGLGDGSVALIASDHASYTRQDVEEGWGGSNISPIAVTAGSASIEFMLPLILTRAAQFSIPIQVVVAAMSERPARLLGVWPRKGAIQIGSDADLTLLDFDATGRLDASKMQSKAKISAFDGWEVRGAPRYTIVRGRPVMVRGEVVGYPGYGEFVSPTVGRLEPSNEPHELEPIGRPAPSRNLKGT